MSGAAGAVAIVPVRLQSQRLPRKAMLEESGKPLFLHTLEQARRARCFESVLVATDSEEIVAAAAAADVPVIHTSEAPRTGSERCAEALGQIDARIIVDVQGDWPEVEPGDLEALVEAIATGGQPCATLAAPIRDASRIEDPDVVKLVRSLDGHALYFSRAPIPHGGRTSACLRHVGVYAFSRRALLSVPGLRSSGLAQAERLEQLRFLENGMPIKVLDAHGDPWGIETRADYEAFLSRLSQRQAQAP